MRLEIFLSSAVPMVTATDGIHHNSDVGTGGAR